MDNTQRMIALLGKVRKQMNGAVSESMATHGQQYGLNYGVSIATLREIAQRYAVRLDRLCKLNGYKNDHQLRMGEVVILR